MNILVNALRQYRHNNSEGFIGGYDIEETDKIVKNLLKDKERLDWLADHDAQVLLPKECVENNISSLRSAIDEAMK